MLSKTSQNKSQRLSTFESIIYHIQGSNWKSALQKGCKTYNVKSYNVEKLNPEKVRELYQRIDERFYMCERSKNGVWIQNQLRLFIWILLLTSQIKNMSPQQYTEDDWKPLALIFQGKSIQTLKFQYKSITNKKVSLWNQEQDELLKQMIRQRNESNPNWNQISRDLFSISQEKYFKTSKQCRQHWNNYLNPKVLKSQWDKKQDYLLMKYAVQKGRQWSAISKILDAKRTEHMVKNRFKSIVLTYSKEFNISKKHAQTPAVLQRILKRIKAEVQQIQQSNQESIQSSLEEDVVQKQEQIQAQKSAFQLIRGPSAQQSTTFGANSPAIFSPCQFGFQFPQGLFPHFVFQMPVVSVDTNIFQAHLYSIPNRGNQQMQQRN